MTQTQCTNCNATSTIYLCGDCESHLQEALEQIPWLLRELAVTVTRQDRLNLGVVGKASEEPSPINFGAARLAREVEGFLIEWVDLLVTAGVKFFPAMSVGTNFIGPLLPHWKRLPKGYSGSADQRARWLAHHVHQIALHPKAGDVYGQVVDLTGDPDKPSKQGRLVRAIDKVTRVYAGTCPTPVARNAEGIPITCGLDLFAEDGMTEVVCRRCEETIDVQRNRQAAIMSRDLLPEARLCEVTKTLDEAVYSNDIQRWLKQGRLKPSGYLSGTRIVEKRLGGKDARLFSLSRVRQLRWQDQQEKVAS